MTYRFFARSELNTTSPITEQSYEQLEARGGMGDELSYYEEADAFEADDALELIPNPVPGNPLAGTKAIILSLEAASI
jgi:hypothetical protein